MKAFAMDNSKTKIDKIAGLRVTFGDDYRGYKEFDLVVTMEALNRMFDECKLGMEQDSEFESKVYNDVINKTFRPRTTLDEITESMLRYACSKSDLCDRAQDYPDGDFLIITHINVDFDENSHYNIMPREILERIDNVPEFPLEGFPENGISMSYKDRLDFLDMVQKTILLRIFKDIKGNNRTYADYYQQDVPVLFNSIEDDDNVENIVYSTLEQLCFYGYITHEVIQKPGKSFYHRLTILQLKELEVLYEGQVKSLGELKNHQTN